MIIFYRINKNSISAEGMKRVMHKNFYGYQSGKVETKYIVEYIDDEKTWNKFLSVTGNGYDGTIEPWELFTIKEYDDITEAINFFVVKGSHEKTYHIQMMENIYHNEKLILENPVEFSNGLHTAIAMNVNEDLRKRLIKCSNEWKKLQAITEHYKNFIQKYHAEEQFKEFLKEQEEV